MGTKDIILIAAGILLIIFTIFFKKNNKEELKKFVGLFTVTIIALAAVVVVGYFLK